eukprot:TRINITY_DN55409_c0_g1_i1.p1 TRINITY_DN55409_c0_g1~~TRINITY_DN55409_c0_g1_i1.p1  ORF type:complete len:313 (-),score=16.51 TRINITY_DN55409_c0_g1_i1:538-1437(-)
MSNRDNRDSVWSLPLEFVDPPEEYQCSICVGPAKEACVTEECGHLFCKKCIMQALALKQECPVDRISLTPQQVRKDVRVQRKVLELKVHCIHNDKGCQWTGEVNSLLEHISKCTVRPIDCPYAEFGCRVSLTGATYEQHLQDNMAKHNLLLLSGVKKLQEQLVASEKRTIALQRIVALSHDSDYFVWSVVMRKPYQGTEVSKIFRRKGLNWYMKIDFDADPQFAAVYLYASGHHQRATFQFTLFNRDPARDVTLRIDDWAASYKGKGWGNKRFVDKQDVTSFLIEGRVTIGVHILGEPY